VYIVKDGCPGCGNCKSVCPVGAVEQAGVGVKINSRCVDCGVCVAVCPVNLIAPGVPGKEEPVQVRGGLKAKKEPAGGEE
jgi:ferredoxin